MGIFCRRSVWFTGLLLGTSLLGVLLPSWAKNFLPGNDPLSLPWLEHVSVNQGLSHPTVLCIYQDREGFLWIGTQDGLNKYDGYSFTIYSPDPSNPAGSLNHNWITSMLEDQRGFLWVTTLGGGLSRIDKRTDQVTSYWLNPDPTHPLNTCFALCQDQQGKLWVGTAGGLVRFDPQVSKVTSYGSPFSDNPAVFAVAEDSSGELWIGGAKGLFGFNHQTGKYTPVVWKHTRFDSLPGVFAIHAGKGGVLWVAAQKGLYQAELSKGQITLHRPPQSSSIAGRFLGKPLWQDASGLVWAALSDQSGLQRFNPHTGQWTVYRADPQFSSKLTSNQIHALFQDDKGILWIGTDSGLNKLMPQQAQFHTIQLLEDDHAGRLPQNRIQALWEDRTGRVWLSNQTGDLYAYTLKTGQFTSYKIFPSHSPNTRINAIYEDRTGQLWMGTELALLRFERKTGQFTSYLCPIGVQTIREAPDGTLWISGRGIAAFQKQTGQFKYYHASSRAPHELKSEGIVTLLPSRSGSIWVATNDRGLARLNPLTDGFTYYQPDDQQPAGHPNDKDIRCLYEDADGILWLGSNQGGLNRFDPARGAFTAFTTRDGLPNNHIMGIQEDQAGNLWLATNRGLCRFNPQTKACRTYDQRDGLQDNVFYEVCAKGPGGVLLFGGPNGFNRFAPGSIRDNPQKPPVYITRVQVLNQPRTLPADKLILSHAENLLSFDFVALNFIRSEKNQYAYQLVGFDKDWLYCGSKRFASYTNLPPGEYTFRVKASNNDGIWNEKGASVPFIIRPPFWQQAWFVSVSVLTLVGLTYAGFGYRLRQIRREEAQKTAYTKQLAQMEMQALRAQMNPHFIFNCLNSINSYILDNEPETASDYLSKFSKLIRLILQHSSAATIPLERELEALRLYLTLESLRFERKFTFALEVGPEVAPALVEIPPMIIQPYVENAIWHGLMHKEGGGHIAIAITQREGQLICRVEDNGVGRQKAAELKSKSATRSKSMGMQITASRLALSQSLGERRPAVRIVDLVDAAGEPAGTRVLLTIPLK